MEIEDDPFALAEDTPPAVPPPPPLVTALPRSKLMPAKARRPVRETLLPPKGVKKALFVVGEYFPGLFHLSTLAAGIILLVAGLGLWGLGLFWFFIGATFEGILACSMGLFAQLQALSALIGGTLDLLHEALACFTSRQWTTFFICWLGPFTLLFCLGMIYRPEASRGKEKAAAENASTPRSGRTWAPPQLRVLQEARDLQERTRQLGAPANAATEELLDELLQE